MATRHSQSTDAWGREHLLDVETGMTGYPPWRTRRSLTKGAMFDPTLPTPVTYLTLGPDGEEPPLEVEFWHYCALMTEALVAGDTIDFAFESFWPHKITTSEPGSTYVPRWVATAIYTMSRTAPSPLRVPPPQEAIWGAYEQLLYLSHLRTARGHW
jgi:hypothetical protein